MILGEYQWIYLIFKSLKMCVGLKRPVLAERDENCVIIKWSVCLNTIHFYKHNHVNFCCFISGIFFSYKGFEPRGTAIGQRLVTWNNMVKNTGYKATLANYPFKYADEQAKMWVYTHLRCFLKLRAGTCESRFSSFFFPKAVEFLCLLIKPSERRLTLNLSSVGSSADVCFSRRKQRFVAQVSLQEDKSHIHMLNICRDP